MIMQHIKLLGLTWVRVTGPNCQGTKDPDFRARFKAEVRNRDTWMIDTEGAWNFWKSHATTKAQVWYNGVAWHLKNEYVY